MPSCMAETGCEDNERQQPMMSVVTQPYHFPPAELQGPPAEECSSEQLLDLAKQACRAPSDLGALQGSPDHLRRICELLGSLHKHVVEQESELGDRDKRLIAVDSLMSRTRDQIAIVRRSLDIEIEAHQATQQQADRERGLRLAAEEEQRCAEEELRRVVEKQARDSERLARAMRLLSVSFDRARQVMDMVLDPGSVDGAQGHGRVEGEEKTVVDVPCTGKENSI